MTSLAGQSRRLVASTISPVLCTSFLNISNPPSGLSLDSLYALELTNGGGQRVGEVCTANQPGSDPSRCLWGVRTLSVLFGQGTALSRITAGVATTQNSVPYVQCYDATIPNATLSSVPAPGDLVFGDGFELPVPDVRVQFVADSAGQEPLDQLVHTVNVPGTYRVVVSNRSTIALTGVRLREFLPGAVGSLSPAVTALSCSEVIASGEAPCPRLTLDMQIDLAANQTRVFRVARQISGGAAIDPSVGALLAVAAFVDPAQGVDANPSDNVRSLRLGTVTLPAFNVNATVSGGNGTVTPALQQTTQGQAANFTLAPAANYQVNTATDNCGAGGAPAGTRTGLSYSIPNITQACTLTVSYRPLQYAVTVTVGSDGAASVGTPLVDHGGTAEFTLTPEVGFSGALTGNSACGAFANNSDGTWSSSPVTGACTATASFSRNRYTITPVAGPNGAITPNQPQTDIPHGTVLAFTLAPSPTYRIANVTGCDGVLAGSFYLVTALSDCTINATFELMIYSFGAAASTNGAIAIADPTVIHGSTGSFTVTPDTGYSTGAVTGTPACGTLAPAGGVNWITGAITSNDCVVSASFSINQYLVRLTTSGGNGTIGDPAGTAPIEQTVNYNSTASARITPAFGYSPEFTASEGNCSFSDPDQDQTWTSSAITGNCTVNVTFALNRYPVTAAISSSSPANSATVTPLTQNVTHGSNHFVEVRVNTGYSIVGTAGSSCSSISLLSAGTPGNANDPATYRVNNVTAACSVEFNVVAD